MNLENNCLFQCTGLGLTLITIVGCVNKTTVNTRPNIIIIMADDLGYSDLGCYGSEIPTPNLDRLAETGLRLTQFYNTSRSAPSRASLLTGLYSHQAGMGELNKPSDRPAYLGRLNEKCVTFAEVLKEAGYQTFMTGKWHVSHYDEREPDTALHPQSWPLQRGFDKFFGTHTGAGSYFNPVSLMHGNTFIDPPDNFYYTDAINDTACSFIENADKDNPFVLYVAHVAPHWPLHALPHHIKMFDGVYNKGWDNIRTERYERMLKYRLFREPWVLSPRDDVNTSWKDTPDKEWEAHRMAVYAAQIYCMDEGIGRIVETLRRTGRYENTLILFLSDNGGCRSSISGDPDHRYGFFPLTGETPEIFPGGPETLAAYGRAWANASNTPFRLYKMWMNEGGISTPLIAHWPAVINSGKIIHQVGHIIDIMPTLIEISGGVYPTHRNRNEILPFEGNSLAPLFHGEAGREHEDLFWEHFGNRAVREGNWKLVAEKGGKWELYDIENDRTEINDLSDIHTDRVRRMKELWKEWAVRVNCEYTE